MEKIKYIIGKYWREIILLIILLSIRADVKDAKQNAERTYDYAADAASYAKYASDYASDAANYASEAADNSSYCY